MDYQRSESDRADLNYMRQSMAHKILERDEEALLAIAWKDKQDEHAMHELIKAYMRLVVSTASKYKHYGIPVADMIQEGNLGLLHAATRFDPGRGFRFSTYAKWWIRAFIQDYILRNWSIVRTGSTTAQKQLFFNLRRLKSQLLNVSSDAMNYEEQQQIAEALNVSIRDVCEMESRLALHDLSLSAPISLTNDEEFQSMLRDEGLNPEESSVKDDTQSSQRVWIDSALTVLNPRERYIISNRHLSEAPKTLEALGQELSITKERVRQIETRAIRKMRFKLMERLGEVRQTITNF